MRRVLAIGGLLAVTACGGGGTSSPTTPSGSPGTPDVNSLTKVVLPVGNSNCPTGGISVTVNGGAVEYVCNGAVGPQGPQGPTGPTGAAGGGTGGGSGSSAAGSRLQIPAAQSTKHTGVDGSVYYTTTGGDLPFYDTSLGVYCNPGLASDGSNRCIPQDDPRLPGSVGMVWSAGYADIACAVSAVIVYSASCTPKYATQSVAYNSCPYQATASVYSVGAKLSVFFMKSGATCVDSSTYLSFGTAYLATVVAPSALVAFTP